MTDPGYPTPEPNTTPPAAVPPQDYGTPQPMPPAAPQQPYAQVPFTPAAPPPGYASAEDKTWALVATFGAAVGALICGVGGFIPPLVSLLVKGSTSPTVRQQAVASLNFQAPISAIAIIVLILRGISEPALFDTGGSWAIYWLLTLVLGVVALTGIIFGILAGMKANEGSQFKYPVNLNIIK